jgi:fatty-acyl-CoA synthase
MNNEQLSFGHAAPRLMWSRLVRFVPTAKFLTLADAIKRTAELYPKNGFTFQDDSGREVTYTFPQIETATGIRAAALQGMGLTKGDRLALVISEPEDFVITFLAALRVGIVPVPVSPHLYPIRVEVYCRQIARVLANARARAIVASAGNQIKILHSVAAFAGSIKVKSVGELHADREPEYPEMEPDDLAFLQYTSGSTRAPLGVMVTYSSLFANVTALFTGGLRIDPTRDIGVTWLPLFHDMGLVGFVLGPLFFGTPVVFIPTTRFVRNPSVWLNTIDRHRATISFAPTFAFALAARRVRLSELESWDLSCVRILGCGAEPINPAIMRRFVGRFAQYCKLDPNVILPSYGLAEATLAVTMKPLGEPMQIRSIDRAVFERKGVAREAAKGHPAVEHVACGTPLPGFKLQITTKTGAVLPERTQGEIRISGPSIAAGYFHNAKAWGRVYRNGWLRTGDLGYLSDNQLYVAGRSKDLIILNGRNLHPQEIEWAVAEVKGVRAVVAFSRLGEQGEELVVVVESHVNNFEGLRVEIEEAIQRVILTKPADIVFVEPRSLSKTSSGKPRRNHIRQQYLKNRLALSQVGVPK